MIWLWSLGVGCVEPAEPPHERPEVSHAVDPTGTWSGSLEVEEPIRMDFTFQQPEQGDTWTVDLRFPDGNREDRVAPAQVVPGGMRITGRGWSVELWFTGSDTADANWIQGGSFPFALTRGAASAPLRKPQEPVEPVPYASIDVTVAGEGVSLGCTFTRPAGEQVVPALVYLSGSGRHNRDGRSSGHRPFLVLADHLAREGVASLRCDDRGFLASTGDFDSAGLSEFASDAAAGVRWLESRPDVGAVGVLGHSDGSSAALLVDADFAVHLMGSFGSPVDVLVDQYATVLRSQGKPEAEVRQGAAALRAVYEAVRSDPTDRGAIEQLVRELPGASEAPEEAIRGEVDAMVAPVMVSRLQLDEAAALRARSRPTLAIWGGQDQLVSAALARPAFDAIACAACTSVVLEEVDHWLRFGGTHAEGAAAGISVVPELLSTISGWVLTNARPSGEPSPDAAAARRSPPG